MDPKLFEEFIREIKSIPGLGNFLGANTSYLRGVYEQAAMYGVGAYTTRLPPDPDSDESRPNAREEAGHMSDNSEGFSYRKLIKLLGMTTSANDAEALSFIRAANSELDKLGKTWSEFIMSKVTVVADPFDKVPTPTQSTSDIDTAYGRGGDWRNRGATAPQRPPPPRTQRQPSRPAPAPDYSYMGPKPRANPDPFATTQGKPATAKSPGAARIENKFAGLCTRCKERVGPGEGEAFLDGKFANGKDRWSVEHTPGGCLTKAKPQPIKGTMSDLDDMIQDIRLMP